MSITTEPAVTAEQSVAELLERVMAIRGKLHDAKAYLMTRPEINFFLQRHYSQAIDKTTSLRCVQSILLKSVRSLKAYPETLRRIGDHDHRTIDCRRS